MDHDTAALDGQLAELCYSHILGTEDLAKAESETLDDLFGRLRTAFGLAITRFDEKVFAEREPGWKVRDRRTRRIFTEFGEVEYSRRIYIDDYGERSTLADELPGMPKARYLSPNAFSLVTRFAADIPYARSAGLLCRHAHSSLSTTAVMGSMRALGSILDERDRAASRELFAEGLAPDAELEREEVCAEADGIWVHLQHDPRDMAEVKAFCAYSGKEDGVRQDVVHHAAIAAPGAFSRQAVAKLGGKFDLSALKRCHLGSDGGPWCVSLQDYIKGAEVVHHLDPWHVNRMVREAFPLKTARNRACKLLYAGDAGPLIGYLTQRAAQDTRDRDKVRSLLRYVRRNRESIEAAGPSLGTMEGTNAHVYAARMKAWGGGWSRKGASDMARIRSTIFLNRELPRITTPATYGKQSSRRRDALRSEWSMGQMGYTVYESEGSGYEPPGGRIMPFSTSQSLVKLWPEWAE